MLKFTSIVGYTSCAATYIESFLTIIGQCINVLNYDLHYMVRPSGISSLQRTDLLLATGGSVNIPVYNSTH